MPKEKKKLTREELSAIRRAASLSRKTYSGGRNGGHNGGRPKGSTVGKTRTISIYASDKAALSKLAFASNSTLVDFMHTVAEALKARNEEVFSAPEVRI